jgi:dienelactone hydrolase
MTANRFSIVSSRRGCFLRLLFCSGFVVFLTAGPGKAFAGGAFDRLAAREGFSRRVLSTENFPLLAYIRPGPASGGVLRVYIEGDGVAWKGRYRLSDDPAPRDTLVLRLAAMDPSEAVAYLARPCQFIKDAPSCADTGFWSSKRFSAGVIFSSSQALDRLKSMAGAKKLELVGFSGGGAVAALLAARRQDVLSLRTIAGNLDHVIFSQYHGTSPLRGSLNPADEAEKLIGLPQRHFVCDRDRVVPKDAARSFLISAGDAGGAAMTVVDRCTHNKGWDRVWKELLSLPLLIPGEQR